MSGADDDGAPRGFGAFAMRLLHLLPPEAAHRLTIAALAGGIHPRCAAPDPPSLAVELWGRHFSNPIGLSAGFDKDAEVPDAVLAWGFGFTEVGTITPRPQDGNPRPRLFRVPEHRALINRLGFNSRGLDYAQARLSARARRGIVGVNVGKNKDSAAAVPDYCAGVAALGRYADYFVVNVSSPNTPGLRDLQRRDEAYLLLMAVLEARQALGGAPPPLLIKIAPDLSGDELAALADAALAADVDGIVLGNTTVSPPETVAQRWRAEPGGFSGPPLFAASTKLLGELRRQTAGRLPLVGVGGVSSGADAYAKILAGASLVQLYTALVFHGPAVIGRIKRDLAACLARDGFGTVAEAVGQAIH